MSNFLTRTITGAVFVLLITGSVYFHYMSFGILVFILITLGLLEFYKLFSASSVKPLTIYGVVMGIATFLEVFYLISFSFNTTYLLLFLPLTSGLFIYELFRKQESPFPNVAVTLLGVFYIALPFSLLFLCAFPGFSYSGYRPEIVLGYFMLLWTSDTGAYLVGRTFGKHPLFPRISPKKSWEGLAGGIVFTLLVAFFISRYFIILSFADWIIIALIICCFGVLGDLIESMLKRSLQIKDSGNILPGHGGILDRFDSVIFSAPFVFLYLHF